ncbi:glycosyltransferase family 4 protein [Riemerella anatipestifer]|uniref:glycosyltransferase n=1 Tax=Riemerella anatipestifer TaxID=34085 RepID=UPI0030C0FCBF
MRKIYFFCPSNTNPTGGVKQIYRQVDNLNRLGYLAVLLLKKRSSNKNKWYSTEKIAYNYDIFCKVLSKLGNKKKTLFDSLKRKIRRIKDTVVEKDGIIVMPEIYGSQIHKSLEGRKYVIFNQNCYYTFQHYNFRYSVDNPYLSKDCLGVIVASDDAYKYLRYVFPGINIQKITLGIDKTNFYYSENKAKKICYMPRKLKEDSEQVILILKAKSLIEGWELCALDNMSEEEVARNLREAVLFLSFNHREGFGLPPVEAMACGCYVIGYKGQAGREYFNTEFSEPVADGDIIQFVQSIERAIQDYDRCPSEILNKGKRASEYVLEKYSMENEFETTKKAWENLLVP